MNIRPARPEEYGEAGRITVAAYREFVPEDPGRGWLGYLHTLGDVEERARHALVLVAEAGGRLIGTVTLELGHTAEGDERPERETANIRMLAVDPSARGRGAGQALMEACIERARQEGRLIVTLHTTGPMEVARGMYERRGFVRQPERDVELQDGALIAYRLELPAPSDPPSLP